ncbi:MAG: MGMT family protein [Candidatus Levyibacteriota bacterium]
MNSFDKVYKLVSLIPKGKVTTYKQISQISDISPRVVGFALHANKNPETVPCHRVVNIKGQLAKGYAFGGRETQGNKLEEEGVSFLDEKTVDLSKSSYTFTK